MPNLDQIAKAQERAVLIAFQDALQSVRDQATLSEVVRALEVGNVEAAIDLLQLDEATFQPIEEAIRQAYREGGLTGAEQIGPIPIEAGTLALRFNIRAPAAEQWLSQMSSRLITEIFTEQRDMARTVMRAGLQRGQNPRQTALDMIGRVDNVSGRRIGGFIGLTSQQSQWVINARDELENLNPNYLKRTLRDARFDRTIRRAIEEGRPLTAKQIDSAIARMQANAQRYRGEVISRTESINALRAGQDQAVRQAIALGEVSEQDVTKEWDATGDARTRLDHLQMEQTYSDGIPFSSPFVAPDLSQLMYPGDTSLGASGAQTIQCRCRAKYRIDFGARVARIEGFR